MTTGYPSNYIIVTYLCFYAFFGEKVELHIERLRGISKRVNF